MIYFFYLLAMIPLYLEFVSLYNPSSKLDFLDDVKMITKTSKEKGSILDLKFKSSIFIQFFLNVFYILWAFCGLMTSQWLVFLTIILIGFIPKTKKYIIQIDGFLSIVLIIFAVLNQFHLHIDLYHQIMMHF